MGKSAVSTRSLEHPHELNNSNDDPRSTNEPRNLVHNDNDKNKSKKDNVVKSNSDNGSNSIPSRSNLAQSNFLFNYGRQELLGSLLNNYSTTTYPNTNNTSNPSNPTNTSTSSNPAIKPDKDNSTPLPNYYTKDPSLASVIPNDGQRPRGDSIFLPPPVNSQFRFLSSEGDNQNPAGSGISSNPNANNIPNLPSRSNSIFSSLIQIPGGNNSVSGDQMKPKGRQMSALPNDYSNQIPPQDFDNYFNNKESLTNLLAWQQQQQQQQDRKNSKSSKNSSIDLSNPAIWESITNSNGSISGLNNGSLGGILAGLSNGSIDFTNMSNEQRRDSILKLINDPQVQQQRQGSGMESTTSSETRLREDMFDNKMSRPDEGNISTTKTKRKKSQKKDKGEESKPSINNKGEDPLSPTTSLSSKSSTKFNEIPQSPKTSPNYPTRLSIEGGETVPPGQTANLSSNQALPPNVSAQQLFPQQMPPHQLASQQMAPNQQRYFPNYQTVPPNQYQYNNYQNMTPQGQYQSPSYNNSTRTSQPSTFNPRLLQSYQNPQYIPPSFTNFQNNYSPQGQMPGQQPVSSQQLFLLQQSINPQQPISNAADASGMEEETQGGLRRSKGRLSQSARSKVLNKDSLNEIPPVDQREEDKPVLGATKIDQLMLVLQSRDKNNDVSIRQTSEGEIVGDVKSQNLTGGVEKQKIEDVKVSDEENDDDDEETKSRKRRKKLPQCPYCYKYFAQTTQLEVHIRSHIGFKPFECTYCHKRFTQGGNLTTHLRLHTGEKPFTCNICNRSFSRKGNLAAHKLTHENLKPYACRLDNCDKSFTQLGNLKSHQNKFHLNTLTAMTQKIAQLDAEEFSRLPKKEQELLNYFKDLYKNSNKGIKGRGKNNKNDTNSNAKQSQPVAPNQNSSAMSSTRNSYSDQYQNYFRSMNNDPNVMINDLNHYPN